MIPLDAVLARLLVVTFYLRCVSRMPMRRYCGVCIPCVVDRASMQFLLACHGFGKCQLMSSDVHYVLSPVMTHCQREWVWVTLQVCTQYAMVCCKRRPIKIFRGWLRCFGIGVCPARRPRPVEMDAGVGTGTGPATDPCNITGRTRLYTNRKTKRTRGTKMPRRRKRKAKSRHAEDRDIPRIGTRKQ